MNFSVDTDTFNFPVPLDPLLPEGSLVYDPPVMGLFHGLGDADRFRIPLDSGQSLTIRLTPLAASIQGRIELFDPAGASLGTIAAGSAGQTLVLQTRPIVDGGDYEFEVTALAGAGDYRVEVILNAGLEGEGNSGPTNNDRDSAQSIQESAISLQGSANRLAVLGQLTSGDVDFYSFEMAAGQTASLALAAHDAAGDLVLDLLDDNGVRLASGIANSDGHQFVDTLIAPRSGMYFVRVSGGDSPYTLVVTRDATFDIEPNSRSQDAQFIGPSNQVLGSLGERSGATSATGTIRVAVLHASEGFQTANQLNDDTYFDFSATLVSAAQIDTVAELDQFDVVVIGDSSSRSALTTVGPALRQWVESGGGVVGTGWTIFASGASTGGQLTEINAIIPVDTSTSYNYNLNPSISVLDSTHPVTAGVASGFFPGDYVEFPNNGADPGTTVLATANGQPAVVVDSPNRGRSVYLGPIYMTNGSSMRTGNADRLLEQAVAWAGRGDREDNYEFFVDESASTLVITTTTPGDGAGEPASDLDRTSSCTTSLDFWWRATTTEQSMAATHALYTASLQAAPACFGCASSARGRVITRSRLWVRPHIQVLRPSSFQARPTTTSAWPLRRRPSNWCCRKVSALIPSASRTL